MSGRSSRARRRPRPAPTSLRSACPSGPPTRLSQACPPVSNAPSTGVVRIASSAQNRAISSVAAILVVEARPCCNGQVTCHSLLCSTDEDGGTRPPPPPPSLARSLPVPAPAPWRIHMRMVVPRMPWSGNARAGWALWKRRDGGVCPSASRMEDGRMAPAPCSALASLPSSPSILRRETRKHTLEARPLWAAPGSRCAPSPGVLSDRPRPVRPLISGIVLRIRMVCACTQVGKNKRLSKGKKGKTGKKAYVPVCLALRRVAAIRLPHAC